MRKTLLIVALIIAGEMVFGLPFNTTRFFRPTMLEVFGFSNTQLGDVSFWYGVVAMLAYFPGGALADHFSARRLLTVSLFTTAAGGLYMATIPGELGMKFLFAYWGGTTIFLFWGALIRATRDWGGIRSQGRAFGLLDGGRGLVAAAVAAFAVAVFALQMPEDVHSASDALRRAAFVNVILIYSAFAVFAGVLCWILVPEPDPPPGVAHSPLGGMLVVVRRPIVWIQAGVVVCAYCGFKGLDNFSLYADQVLEMNEVDAARFSAWGAWLRPVAAILAGLFADRFSASRAIALAFALMMMSFLLLGLATPVTFGTAFILANVFVSFFAVFALRAVYFALLQDTGTPEILTGSTVGLVSFAGFTPDVFFGPISGRILDANPGVAGFQNYFLFLAAIAVVAICITAVLIGMQRRGIENLWPDEIKHQEARS
jgi:nitrate/nitrite transporter NarK